MEAAHFKLGGAELGRDLVYGALMERSRPAHILWVKIEAKAIHGVGRYS
jgi:hypothetical protein